MRRVWRRVAIVAGVVIVVSVGGRLLVAPLIISHPDTVRIVVTQEVRNSTLQKTVIFDHQYTSQATAVYSELVAGGPVSGNYFCPIILDNRPYYHYELTFYRWGITTARATSDAVGCAFFAVRYPLGTTEGYSWYRGEESPSFWVRLYELTNAPQPLGP